MSDDWLCGFFEGQASFAVNIGLGQSKNKRYYIFKPYISIVSVDADQVKYISQELGLTHSGINKKVKEKMEHNQSFSLNIQNVDDIHKVVMKLSSYKFKSSFKQEKFLRFVSCYKDILKIGDTHTVWNEEYINIINKKLSINIKRSNIDKNRFSSEEWVEKIKDHLDS